MKAQAVLLIDVETLVSFDKIASKLGYSRSQLVSRLMLGMIKKQRMREPIYGGPQPMQT
jgi:hypothetical protein